jgi:hypothetical protein
VAKPVSCARAAAAWRSCCAATKACQASPEERLRKLADLFGAGLLTAEVYQQRQAEIAREV